MAPVGIREVRGHRLLRGVLRAQIAKYLGDGLTGPGGRQSALPELERDIAGHGVVHFPQRTKHRAKSSTQAVAGESAEIAEHLATEANHAGVEKDDGLVLAAVFGVAKE